MRTRKKKIAMWIYAWMLSIGILSTFGVVGFGIAKLIAVYPVILLFVVIGGTGLLVVGGVATMIYEGMDE